MSSRAAHQSTAIPSRLPPGASLCLRCRSAPTTAGSALTPGLHAALEVKGKLLHLGDVCKMLRNSEDPQGVLQALRALQALLPAQPEELSLHAGT